MPTGIYLHYRVCYKTNSDQRVYRDHFKSVLPRENCGGDHCSRLFEGKKQSVKSFIESLVPLESHYCWNTSTNKQFLDSDLSIKKLHDMYNNNNSFSEGSLKVNYEYFHIFVTEYNISFDSPAVHQCRKCLEYEQRLKLQSAVQTHFLNICAQNIKNNHFFIL